MKTLKNAGVGFLVSFVGSIPLGYLNIVGLQIYAPSGTVALIYYLLGVISIEGLVIYATLIFANKLASNHKLLRLISLFSILFMLLLAYVFYAQAKGETTDTGALAKYLGFSSYLIGVILSSLNFIQIPFWLGWNLYLLNAKYIVVEKQGKYSYVAGTLGGTFFGMLVLVRLLDFITGGTNIFSKHLLSHFIPLLFLGMAVYQMFQYYRKYYGSLRGKE
ncbi:MAG: hypothetical protein H7199_09170 [Burkholderiales bacterium]|nr:hypothetical protein [Flavobacterium sp.]